MNPISEQLNIGTIGELLVQLRLLQFEVQAAAPLKDTGNDLIAIRGNTFRAIQVKSTRNGRFNKNSLPDKYHILAVVHLVGENDKIFLDKSKIFLIPKDEVANIGNNINDLNKFKLTTKHIEKLF